MIYLDFYLKDNGRMEYTKDISLTQYSTKYIVRLLTKKTFDIVNMNITLPNQIKTYKKNLQLQSMKVDGYYAYTYQLGLDTTGFEIGAEKAQIKVGFFLYPDKTNQKDVLTSALCYLPILASTDDMPSDGSITNSELSNIQSSINEINLKLEHLNVGNIDTAQNYDTTRGNIKEKFDRLDAQVQNVETDVKEINQFIENLDLDGNTVGGSIKTLQEQIDGLKETDVEFSNSIKKNSTSITENTARITDNEEDITILQTNIINLKTFENTTKEKLAFLEGMAETNEDNISKNKTNLEKLQKTVETIQNVGIEYIIVDELPATPRTGVIYLKRDTENPEAKNRFTEHIYIEGYGWENLGNSDLNLDEYLKIADANSTFVKVADGATKSELTNAINTTEQKLTQNLNEAKSELRNLIPTTNGTLENTAGYITNSALDPYEKTVDVNRKVAEVEAKIPTLPDLSPYAKKEDIPTNVSQFVNDTGYITIVQTDAKYATKSELASTKSELQENITKNSEDIVAINEDITSLGEDLSRTNETAETALALAEASSFAKVFDSFEQLYSYIRTKQTVDPVKVGTFLFLRNPDLPDYWISAVFTSPQDYTTQGGQVLEDVYYGVEEVEGLVDLSEYYTKAEANETFVEDSEYKAEIATKENHSNKTLEINSSSTDVQYPSAGAVYRDAEARKAAMEKYLDDNYFRKETHQSDIDAVYSTINTNVQLLQAADVGINNRLDAHDNTLVNHETRISENTGEINKLNTNLTALSNKHNAHEEAFEVYKANNDQRSKDIEDAIDETNALLNSTIEDLAEEAVLRENRDLQLEEQITGVDTKLDAYIIEAEKYLEEDEVINQSRAVLDYTNEQKRLRFSTDTAESDFVISNKDLNEIQTMLKMFVPNEYN